ncbi:hypothetical protein M3Y95_00818300 [Aphelenchoides besseyi]|nr:hypothetical protein M3Y95_00818300 [Aphelenchoides besseyi]
MNCFPIDVNGHEIVEFAEQSTDRSLLIVVHRLTTSCMCALGFVANGLLITIILFNPHFLCNLRKIVMFAAILDTVYCMVIFLAMPITSIEQLRRPDDYSPTYQF